MTCNLQMQDVQLAYARCAHLYRPSPGFHYLAQEVQPAKGWCLVLRRCSMRGRVGGFKQELRARPLRMFIARKPHTTGII